MQPFFFALCYFCCLSVFFFPKSTPTYHAFIHTSRLWGFLGRWVIDLSMDQHHSVLIVLPHLCCLFTSNFSIAVHSHQLLWSWILHKSAICCVWALKLTCMSVLSQALQAAGLVSLQALLSNLWRDSGCLKLMKSFSASTESSGSEQRGVQESARLEAGEPEESQRTLLNLRKMGRKPVHMLCYWPLLHACGLWTEWMRMMWLVNVRLQLWLDVSQTRCINIFSF